MELRHMRGEMTDLDEICRLCESAKRKLIGQGIMQWDGLYPAREDFASDIAAGSLYTVRDGNRIVAVYTVSEECDEAYGRCVWAYGNACVLHRLIVLPELQGRGIGGRVLRAAESQIAGMGYSSVRLDVFSENPYPLRLYLKSGYVMRGFADWRKGRFYLMEKRLTAGPGPTGDTGP